MGRFPHLILRDQPDTGGEYGQATSSQSAFATATASPSGGFLLALELSTACPRGTSGERPGLAAALGQSEDRTAPLTANRISRVTHSSLTINFEPPDHPATPFGAPLAAVFVASCTSLDSRGLAASGQPPCEPSGLGQGLARWLVHAARASGLLYISPHPPKLDGYRRACDLRRAD